MSKEFVKSVLVEDADDNVPVDANLWPAMHIRLQQTLPSRREPRRLRISPLIVAGALALLLLALGLLASTTLTGLTVTQPEPVSAAELLTRVEHAASEGSSSGLKSFHGVAVAEQRSSSTEEFSHAREERWYLAPSSYRGEAHITTSTGEESVLMVVTNGTAGWRYDSYFGKAEPLKGDEVKATFGATELKGLLGGRMVQSFYNVEVKGSDAVGKRATYVVELTLKPQSEWPAGMAPSAIARYMLWVDSEFFFMLRSRTWDSAGNPLTNTEYESYEVNGAVDPAIFNVPPPSPTK
ncbi:MAG: hypothetical protein M3328_15395 [Chloroflexota bacterium]|nr:hypothetical protein [Chloroflexota bacterium]